MQLRSVSGMNIPQGYRHRQAARCVPCPITRNRGLICLRPASPENNTLTLSHRDGTPRRRRRYVPHRFHTAHCGLLSSSLVRLSYSPMATTTTLTHHQPPNSNLFEQRSETQALQCTENVRFSIGSLLIKGHESRLQRRDIYISLRR